MPRLLSNLTFKYHYVLPCIAKLPQFLAYRLISLYARLQQSEHHAQRDEIYHHMHDGLPQLDNKTLLNKANYYLAMQDREKLDIEFFQKLQTSNKIDRFVQMHNHQPLLEARRQGRRVIITTGHFGRLWMTGIALKRHGITVGTITRDSGEENIYKLPDVEFNYRVKKLNVLKQRLGGPFLVEGDLVRPIYRALDEHVMALLIDVPYTELKEGCYEHNFLGKKARFPLGIAKIAKKTNSLIFPYYVHESRSGLQVDFHTPLEPEKMSEEEIMRQLIEILEKQITSYPEQWWLWNALPLIWKQ